MSYRCEVCKAVAPKGAAKLRYNIYREVPSTNGIHNTRKEIAQEVAVCKPCLNMLEAGVPLSTLKFQKVEIARQNLIREKAKRKISNGHTPVAIVRKTSPVVHQELVEVAIEKKPASKEPIRLSEEEAIPLLPVTKTLVGKSIVKKRTK